MGRALVCLFVGWWVFGGFGGTILRVVGRGVSAGLVTLGVGGWCNR